MRRGHETTGPELGHSVHVELAGLAAGREYFYRFRVGNQVSPAGRTRTTPGGASMAPFTMLFTSCSQYEHGWFTAYRRMAEEEPDLMLHVGDYQYEYAAGKYVAPGDFPTRRAAGLRAYWENMPLRRAQRPKGQDMQLYRRVGWGGLTTFHMLDTRQYRGDQPCDDTFGADCAARTDDARSLPGSEQERWIADGFHRSCARWDVLGQQVFFSQVDFTPGAGRGFNPDAWDGYPGSRNRVVDSWVASGARNLVVLTGDIHSHWAADIKQRFDDPASPVIGSELVSSSVTSGGDGSESGASAPAAQVENPHIRFYDNRRGYVRTRFSASEVKADFRVVPYVQKPGAPAETRAGFVIEDRKPGLQKA